jgi:hypothetical protein
MISDWNRKSGERKQEQTGNAQRHVFEVSSEWTDVLATGM